MGLRHRLVGWAARTYWRLLRPRTLGVRCVLLDHRDRVCLVRHTYGQHWRLPGGGVKARESFKAALARELAEELAVTAYAVERLLGLYHSLAEAKDDHIAVFVVRLRTDPKDVVAYDRAEIAEVCWFDHNALPQDISPATGRRIAEVAGTAPVSGAW